MKDKYLVHLGILFLGISAFAYLFNYFKYNTNAQIVVSALGCVYYVGWGIIHYAVRNRLSKLIILEYILVGTLVFLLLLVSLTL